MAHRGRLEGPARPVIAMLVEPDGATAFVFGKDFYFKVAKKPAVKPCRDVTRAKPAPGLSELTGRRRFGLRVRPRPLRKPRVARPRARRKVTGERIGTGTRSWNGDPAGL